MATCRIYLCTYRRNNLLPRAVKSLLNQTFDDWICELHNDDPDDTFPRKLVEEINDPRIRIVDHSTNMGAMKVFNLVFRNVEDEFVSLLEDDNWWEPDFLEKMISVMHSHPEAKMAWANMRFWKEESDGDWVETKETIWDRSETALIESFSWPDYRQIFGALHSQGAMLVRSQYAGNYQVPNETTSAAGEHVRERVFDYPLIFVPQILGNYALTKETSRPSDGSSWMAIQVMLGGSFFEYVPIKKETLKRLWSEARAQLPKSTSKLIFIGLLYPKCRYILKCATIGDFLLFIAYIIRRPFINFNTLRLIKSDGGLYSFLRDQTRSKLSSARNSGFEAL